MHNILITICARGGSKGVKGKNIRELNGKPLIHYTIKQALKWGRAKRVIVTTDSEEIARIAKKSGAEVPFLRPKELATDNSPTLPVLYHALKESERIYKKKFGILIDLPVTAPVRGIKDLENAFQLFMNKKPKNLVTVTPSSRNPYFNMLEETEDGKVFYSKKSSAYFKSNKNFKRRQDAPNVYDMNNSIYIYDTNFLRNGSINDKLSDHTIAYLMDPLSAIDIDTELDFRILELLVKDGIVKLL